MTTFFAEAIFVQIEHPLSGEAIRWIPYPGGFISCESRFAKKQTYSCIRFLTGFFSQSENQP